MTRYWIGVASYEHVQRGIEGGFAQLCHGKIATFKSMIGGDWIIYYSPTLSFGGKDRCRSFTAIGTLNQEDPYTVEMNEDFIPWRRNVTFLPAKAAPIEPLLNELSFTKNKKSWGLPFRRGSFEISSHDFELIATKMEVCP